MSISLVSTRKSGRRIPPLIWLLVYSLFALTAWPQDIVSPTPKLVVGSASINPDNKTPLKFFTESDAELLNSLKSDETFAALQDYMGFAGTAAAHKSYVADLASGSADVLFAYGPNNIVPAAILIKDNTGFSTSASSGSLRIQGGTPGKPVSFNISLGTWDGHSFANDRSARGVGFTLTGTYRNFADYTVTVSYYSADGTELSTQTYSEDAIGRAAFTGYLNTTGDVSKNVARVTISFTNGTSEGGWVLGLDDFGFTGSATITQ